MNGGTDLVEVFNGAGGTIRADFLTTALEQAGIPSVVSSDSGIAAHPLTVGPMSEFRILVRRADQQRASEIIGRLTERGEETNRSAEEKPIQRRVLGERASPSKWSSRDRALMSALGVVCLIGAVLDFIFGAGLLGIVLAIFGIIFLLSRLGRRT
jgi:hypothetical protein